MDPISTVLNVGMKLLDKFFPDPEQKAKAQIELLQMQQNGELAQINADIAEQQELTKRQQSDMASDSWLSKNIRPMTLIAILAGYFVFALMSAFGMDIFSLGMDIFSALGIDIFTVLPNGDTISSLGMDIFSAFGMLIMLIFSVLPNTVATKVSKDLGGRNECIMR